METNERRCTSVLVVEDNMDIREVVEEALRDEGYRVYGVKNGREAIAVLKKVPGRPLVLLDMMMPVMNGWEFFEHSRKEALATDIPVVVVSALGATAALASRDKALPAVGYLRKPVSLDSLMELVQQYCDRESARLSA